MLRILRNPQFSHFIGTDVIGVGNFSSLSYPTQVAIGQKITLCSVSALQNEDGISGQIVLELIRADTNLMQTIQAWAAYYTIHIKVVYAAYTIQIDILSPTWILIAWL